MFHGSACPKEIPQQCTTTTQYPHRSSAPPGSPLGVFHPCLWPLKAPGCTSGEGRQVSRQPFDSSTPGISRRQLANPFSKSHYARFIWLQRTWNPKMLLKPECRMMIPNIYECRQLKDFFKFDDSRQTAPQICYLVLQQMTKLTALNVLVFEWCNMYKYWKYKRFREYSTAVRLLEQ